MNRINKIYREYPRKFWLVVMVSFIDRVGGTLLFPYFALYITQKFQVGMTEAGLVLGIFSIAGLFGGVAGGAITDRFGRRRLILFGLVASAISTLGLGLVSSFSVLVPLAVLIGMLFEISGPAHMAMLADILPEKQRQEGFGILRVVNNFAWIIGPTIGGFIANRSFFTLFVIDAVVSCLVAVLFYRLISETYTPIRAAGEQGSGSIFATFKGYILVLRDSAYLGFLGAGIAVGLVYQQLYNSLSVYLRDVHGIAPQGYGFLMSVSGITVILLQFWVTRRIKHHPPFVIMAAGSLFYAAGFTMFGLVSRYELFVLAVVVITVGEMAFVPTSQALASSFAPEEMRGRYMAAFSLMWSIPSAIGPAAAGVILDHYNPNLLWWLGGVLCAVAALGYLALQGRLGAQPRFASARGEAEAAGAG